MRIAVCDDDPQELLRVTTLLSSYCSEWQERLTHTAFQSATELLATMPETEYDLLLLDVLMPGIGGIQAAQEIRTYNDTVQIVFLTSTPEFAVESYQVKALNYLLKPATAEQLFPILDRLMDERRQPEAAVHIKTKSRVFRLPYRRIEYIEVMAKTLYFHMTDGSREEIAGSLSDYEAALLAQPGFVKVHRSYLVNLRWVCEVCKWELTTVSGCHVPVSRPAYPQVRQAYMEQLFADADFSISRSKGGRA